MIPHVRNGVDAQSPLPSQFHCEEFGLFEAPQKSAGEQWDLPFRTRLSEDSLNGAVALKLLNSRSLDRGTIPGGGSGVLSKFHVAQLKHLVAHKVLRRDLKDLRQKVEHVGTWHHFATLILPYGLGADAVSECIGQCAKRMSRTLAGKFKTLAEHDRLHCFCWVYILSCI